MTQQFLARLMCFLRTVNLVRLSLPKCSINREGYPEKRAGQRRWRCEQTTYWDGRVAHTSQYLDRRLPKLDGYRAIGVKGPETNLYSRNRKNFNKRFPQIAKALRDLLADTVIDGEVVALDNSGRPDFQRLQHFTAEASRIHYFVFDLSS